MTEQMASGINIFKEKGYHKEEALFKHEDAGKNVMSLGK